MIREEELQQVADTSSIWHDASEEPKDGIDILFISKKGKTHKVSKIDQALYEWLKDNGGINKWRTSRTYYRKGVNNETYRTNDPD